MKCPNCGLFNPESAQRCDCGYDFASRSMQQSYLTEKQQQQLKGHRSVSNKHRVLAFVCGAVATAILMWVSIASVSEVRDHSGVLGLALMGGLYMIGYAGAGTALAGGILTLFPRTAAFGQLALLLGLGSGLTTLGFFQFIEYLL